MSELETWYQIQKLLTDQMPEEKSFMRIILKLVDFRIDQINERA